MIQIESASFQAGGAIPTQYTGEGEDISPHLKWSKPSDQTRAFALICDDPDAPMEKPFVHWVAYNIPADRTELPEGDAAGATEGANDFGNQGYGGPMPPPGHGVHHYHFKIYALDVDPGLKPGLSKEDLLAAIERHVLDEGEIIGTYERK